MFFLHKLRNDRLQQGQSAAESIILSPKVVIKAHTILMAGLVDRAGQLRDEYSYAGVPGGGKFYYDPPCLIPCSFSRCLELYTALLSGLAADWDTVHATPALFNLAALVFVQLITIHPFEDGRLLRLLANFVLGAITPFPIPAYIEDGIRSRRTYIDAIMAARNLADATLTRVGPPKDLSALFIECAWQSWQEFVRMLDRYGCCTEILLVRNVCSVATPGSISSCRGNLLCCAITYLYYACRSVFLQSMRGRLLASTFSPARYSLLKDIGLSQQEKEAEIAALQHAIDREHTEANNIKPGHAREIVVDLARDTFVTAIVLKPKMSFG